MQEILVSIGIGTFAQYLFAEYSKKIVINPKKSFRRIKEDKIPLFGGVGIFVTLITTAFLFKNQTLLMFLLMASPLVVGGIIDDIFEISAKFKFLFQFVAASLLMIFNYEELIWQTWAPGTLFVPLLTVFCVICLCNAINFIDGLDGIAVLYMISVLPAIYLLPNQLQQSSPILLGALISFYLFNKHPARIYLGDVGSNLLGFTLAYFFLTHEPVAESHFTILGFLMMFAIPLIDVSMAVVRRISSGQSPLHADKDHIHHRLIKLGLNDDGVAFIYFFIGAMCANVGYLLMKDLGPLIKLSTLLTSACVLTIVLFLVFRLERQVGNQISQFGKTLIETYIDLKGSIAENITPVKSPSLVIDFFSYYTELQRQGLPQIISFIKDVSELLKEDLANAHVYLLSSYSIIIIKADGKGWSENEKKFIQVQFLTVCENHKVPRILGLNPEGLMFCDKNQTQFLFSKVKNTNTSTRKLLRSA